MDVMDVAKDPKMKGEDLALAYDAVRVANKSVCSPLCFSLCFANFPLFIFSFRCLSQTLPLVFRFLESQLRSQHSQPEEGPRAPRQQANQRLSGSVSSDEQCQVHTGVEALIKLQLPLRSFDALRWTGFVFTGPPGAAGGQGERVRPAEARAEGAQEHRLTQTTPVTR